MSSAAFRIVFDMISFQDGEISSGGALRFDFNLPSSDFKSAVTGRSPDTGMDVVNQFLAQATFAPVFVVQKLFEISLSQI